MIRIIHLLGAIFLLIYIVGCASTGSPNGGPKDTDAPDLVPEKSSPNYSTNYHPEIIELEFDEWIELKNQQKEILISPPFFIKPKITLRGKKITVKFPKEEPLRENATYTINFGKSIVDFTEGNSNEGFKYIFSTGDKIDSLTLSGKVINADDGTAAKDMLVLLYDVLSDSVVVNDRPFYYARTSDTGSFQFENLKNDSFKIIALDDINFNFQFDQSAEKVAFWDSLILLNDSSTQNLTLTIFDPYQDVRVLNSDSKKAGRIKLVFNKSANGVAYSVLYPKSFAPLAIPIQDTLFLYYADIIDSTSIIVGVDTFDFYLSPFDSIFQNRKITLNSQLTDQNTLAPFDSLFISFSDILDGFDKKLIILSDVPKLKAINDILSTKKDSMVIDSVNNIIVNIDSADIDVNSAITENVSIYDFETERSAHQLLINSNWVEGNQYRITFLPGSVIDIYGRANDTLIHDFTVGNLTDYGNVILDIQALDTSMHYLVRLLDKKELIREELIKNQSNTTIRYDRLRALTYDVEIVEDRNKDRDWTTGNYWDKRQPEQRKLIKLDKLRESWDLETTIYWDETKKVNVQQIVRDSLTTGTDSINVIDKLKLGDKRSIKKDKKK
ncbi:MAG: Ig-like domain-containing protein [Saprospiraceae bacterium]